LIFDIDLNTEDISIVWKKTTEVSKYIIDYLVEKLYLNISNIGIYFSGSKGIHLLVPQKCLHIGNCHNLHRIYGTIANDIREELREKLNILGLDPIKCIDNSIYQKRRIFRLQDSQHSKTGYFKVMIDSHHLDYDINKITEYASEPRGNIYKISESYNEQTFNKMIEFVTKEKNNYKPHIASVVGSKIVSTKTPPCIQHLLYSNVSEGIRHESIACLASYYKQRGFNQEYTLNRLVEWNDNSTPPLPYVDINFSVSSIYNNNYTYGCKKLSEVSICKEDQCPLKKKNTS
jgi:hypothetical protein